jgi:multimeric flavodoxin WrbA
MGSTSIIPILNRAGKSVRFLPMDKKSMKIIAIMGSPHKGNTLELTRNVEQILSKLGEVEFEYIHLSDIDLKPCKGCYLCFFKGKEHCPLDDDKAMVSDKLDEADGVIFVTPVYSMHVSYLFKTFVDRFACNFHRPRYMGKYAIALAATGAIGLDETLKYIKGMAVSWGFDFVGQLGNIAVPKLMSVGPPMQIDKRTDAIVREFYYAVRDKRPKKLAVSDYIHFHAIRAVYGKLREISPTDYAYFRDKGWLNPRTKYFHDNIRGNALKELIGRFMGWLTRRQIDKALAGLVEDKAD